jgi:hypothetical protein
VTRHFIPLILQGIRPPSVECQETEIRGKQHSRSRGRTRLARAPRVFLSRPSRVTLALTAMPCQAAIDLATRAVEADVAGNHDEAMHLYSAAANELDAAARSTPSEAAEMRGKASEYRARVTVLQQKLQMEQMAAMASGAQMAQRGAAMAHQGKVAVDNAGGVYTVGGVWAEKIQRRA